MLKNLLLLLTVLIVISCQDTIEKGKGELCFKLINFMSTDGFPEEQALLIEKSLDSLKKTNTVSSDKLMIYFSKLSENKLLRLPNIKVKFGDSDIKTIFLDLKQFEKIKKYSLTYLNKNHKKLELELEFKKLETDIYFSDKILTLKEVEGVTQSSK